MPSVNDALAANLVPSSAEKDASAPGEEASTHLSDNLSATESSPVVSPSDDTPVADPSSVVPSSDILSAADPIPVEPTLVVVSAADAGPVVPCSDNLSPADVGPVVPSSHNLSAVDVLPTPPPAVESAVKEVAAPEFGGFTRLQGRWDEADDLDPLDMTPALEDIAVQNKAYLDEYMAAYEPEEADDEPDPADPDPPAAPVVS